jgi:hypothetical protein
MPMARRRRRGHRPGRSIGRLVLVWALVAVVLALVVGSVAEINAQSAPERQLTDRGWGELATRVVEDSNVTGSDLAILIEQAPTIPNVPWSAGAVGQPSPGSNSARARIQQGLDAAVASADQESTQAAQANPPGPPGPAAGLAGVMALRASTVTALRTTIDELLGMTPLPVAGAPAAATSGSTTPADGNPLITVGQATQQAAGEGAAFERADRAYAALAAGLRTGESTGGTPLHLPPSVWAAPATPLASDELSGTPSLLAPPAAAALVPFHQLVVTAVGLQPAAVPATTPGDQAGSGLVGVSCGAPTSAVAVPGGPPAVLPPTTTVAALATVTNCGTVTEVNVPVVETLALDDTPGTPPPPAAASGGRSSTTVTLRAGSSQALDLGTLPVATGHRYTLTVALTLQPPPAGPADLAGTTQEFVLQIAEGVTTTPGSGAATG